MSRYIAWTHRRDTEWARDSFPHDLKPDYYNPNKHKATWFSVIHIMDCKLKRIYTYRSVKGGGLTRTVKYNVNMRDV